MRRVTFDPYYIDDLEDYYRRNECIREQQYLSPEKLLHLAAFCVSKAAKSVVDETEPHIKGPDREVALDVVRQLSLLCENANQVQAQLKPAMIIKGETSQERHNDEQRAAAVASPLVAKRKIGWVLLRSMLGSVVDRLFGCFNVASKTPRG
jgi:hypothetical protein